MKGPAGLLGTLLELTKFRIALVSTLSAGTGYLAFSRACRPGLPLCLAGTLLMAMGSAALNEVQEHRLDALMDRTRLRPIPSGRVAPQAAALLAASLAITGFLLLLAQDPPPAFLGLLAMAWYNGLYTPLKRLTAFAVVPGSVIGALPPAIGWSAAGGSLLDPSILALACFFFLWQVPHFWLLALLHRAGYEQAGLPTLARHFQGPQILRLIFTWTCAALAAGGLLAGSGLVDSPGARLLLFGSCLWLLVRFGALLQGMAHPGIVRKAFLDINLFVLLVMAAVVLDALARSA